MRATLVVAACLSTVAQALSAGQLAARSLDFNLVHELATSPRDWVKHRPAAQGSKINLRIAVKQHGIEELRSHLDEISDPSHPRYGQHFSKEEVDALAAPHPTSLEAVYDWLSDHGIDKSDCKHSDSHEWIYVSVPVTKASEMLNADYHIYKHVKTGAEILRTESYSVPKFVSDRVDAVSPTTWFSRIHANKKGTNVRPLSEAVAVTPSDKTIDGPIGSICNTSSVTSDCLRTFYGSKDYVVKSAHKNKVGVTGYLGEAANFADLTMFAKDQRPDGANGTFSVELVNGGQNPQTLNQTQIDDGTGIEANLDVQTVFGVTFPTPEIFYSTGGSPPFNPDAATTEDTNEPYLEWLEYVLAKKQLPSVVTTSYDDDEQTVPKQLAVRVCDDFLKLGVRGVSVLFASGDAGVGPSKDPSLCITNDGKNTSTFLPEFPSTCPYVTSVGATWMFNPEVAVADPKFSTPFFSGGGFSYYFPQPGYQAGTVPAYVKSLNGAHEGLYNPKGRAYPDVAAQGSNFKIAWQGAFRAVSGTSASTPLFSAFVTLLNDKRISEGKPTLGFLNPWIYTVGKKGLMDITSGASTGCNTTGFPAQQGWDAVTGFGTPNMTKLFELV